MGCAAKVQEVELKYDVLGNRVEKRGKPGHSGLFGLFWLRRIEKRGRSSFIHRSLISDTNIKVKISLPNLSQIKQEGNNKTIVNNITANKFVVKCSGNGDLICSGITNNVKIVSNGNGNVNTKKLISKNASVTKTGNGNIYINTKNKFMVKSTGNGDVVNVGEGKASEESVVEGNGEIIIEN